VGSIPDGLIGFFHWHNPSGHTISLGSTQPLTDVTTSNISRGVKATSAYGWQPYHLHVPIVLKSGSLTLLESSGPVQVCNRIFFYTSIWGTWWRSWLRHCSTSRKVVASIPDGLIGFFHWHNPSDRTISLRSTQLLTDMSTSNISRGVKATSAYGWQPYHLHVPIVLKSGSLNLLESSGPVQACNRIVFLHFHIGHAVAQLVETLRYKPEGRGFDSRWCRCIFSLA